METTTGQPFLDLCYCKSLKLGCNSFTWRNIKNGHAFALVSASRSEMTENQKDKAQAQLVYEAKKLFQCYCTELRGGVIETDFKGDIDSRDEISVYIRGISLRNAIKTGVQKKQDFILYCNGIDFLALIITSEKAGMIGDVFIEFDYRQSDNNLPVIQNAVKEYEERLIKWANPIDFSVSEPRSSHFKLFEMYKRFERAGTDRWLADGRKIM